MAKIGAMGGKAKVEKGFAVNREKASWAGRIGGLARRLGRKPSEAEVEELLGNDSKPSL